MNPAEFVAARLDEDQAAADAATPGPWIAEDHIDDFEPVGLEHQVLAPAEVRIVAGTGLGPVGREAEANAVHIARHDPARTLRGVVAMRAILGLHAGAHGCPTRDEDGTQPYRWTENQTCGLVLHLAAIWADHSDYRPIWSLS